MEKVVLNPYLFFKGNCREAMEFYKSVFGGDVNYMTFDNVPNTPENMKGMIMHSTLKGGDAELMASDSEQASPEAKKIELSLSCSDEAKMQKIFADLSAGGKVKHELKKEFWGDMFGQLTDKYNIDWMVNVPGKKA